jgi:hypothetical protein
MTLLMLITMLTGSSLAIAQAHPAIAQGVSLSSQCQTTLSQVQQRLERDHNVDTHNPYIMAIADQYDGAPRPLELMLWLDAADTVAEGDLVQASAALDLYESTPVLTQLTQAIVGGCADIGAVTYGLTEYQTRTFGIYDDDVMEFGCTPAYADISQTLPWGFRWCF